MRLVLADAGLVVQGRVYEGFPLLIGENGGAVEPAQTFLWDELAANGRAQSKLTWAKYGRDLYDYFAFLEANRLGWRDMPVPGMPGHLDRYRDWSKAEVGLQARTINARLRLIARFYEWAQHGGLLERLPFRTRVVRVRHEPGFLAHVQREADTRVALRAGLGEPVPGPFEPMRRKTFEQHDAPENCLDTAADPTVDLPRNATATRRIDLGPWLGQGVDTWVLTSAAQLRAAISHVAPSSVVTYPDVAAAIRTLSGREKRDDVAQLRAALIKERAMAKRLRDENSALLADLRALASVNETLRQELALRKAAGAPNVVELWARTSRS